MIMQVHAHDEQGEEVPAMLTVTSYWFDSVVSGENDCGAGLLIEGFESPIPRTYLALRGDEAAALAAALVEATSQAKHDRYHMRPTL